MVQYFYYVFATTLLIALVYRPFINKLDWMKYVIITVALWTILLVDSILNNDGPLNMNIDIAANWTSASSMARLPTEIIVINTLKNHCLFKDATALFLFTISSVSMHGLLSRWHFPITFIDPKVNFYSVNLMRHGLSLLIASLAILSQSQIHLFMLAVLSFFWFIAGPYFIRRWKTVIPTMTAITLIGHLSCYFDFNHTTLGSFHFTEWFLLTCIITLACNTFDYLDAILNMYPFLVIPEKRNQAGIQNPISIKYWVAILTLLINMPSELDLPVGPIEDLQTAIRSLGPASRSWKVMAALFPTNLRQDLCLLYSFFRTADDLIDDASTMEIGKQNLFIIRQFLKDVFFGGSKDTADHKFIVSTDLSLPFHLDWNYYATVLPNSDVLAIFRNFSRISHYLCPRAMFELTDAWEADLLGEPLKEQKDLLNYAALISGTFGELCTCAMMYKLGRGNWNGKDSICRNENVLSKARATGQCLQLVNIARDIIADSLVGRCYVPLQYSSSEIYYKLKVLKSPLELGELKLKSYSLRILALADRISDKAQKGIDGLPEEVQDSVRAAFEIYMRIGPTLINDPKFPLRAKVPKREQQWIAMRCLYGFRGSVVQALKNTYRQFGSVVIRAFHIILLN